jgi:mono/diheme cytochrome c family protein
MGLTMRFMSKSIIAVAGFTFAFPALPFAADMPVGRVEYERHCIMCHGATGTGNGWLAWFLRQPVPSLTQLKKKNGGIFPVERVHQVVDGRKEIALHGPRDMPVWGQVYFTEAQRELGPGYGAYDDDKVVRTKILALIDYISMLQE